MEIIEKYDRYWTEIIGGRGFTGKKQRNAMTTTSNTNVYELEVDLSKPKLSKAEAKAKKQAKTPKINTAIFEE